MSSRQGDGCQNAFCHLHAFVSANVARNQICGPSPLLPQMVGEVVRSVQFTQALVVCSVGADLVGTKFLRFLAREGRIDADRRNTDDTDTGILIWKAEIAVKLNTKRPRSPAGT